MTHAELLRALLPSPYNAGAGTLLGTELQVEGAALDAALARAAALAAELDPRTTTELLEDWERVAGLPDSCAPAAQTLDARRKALVGRLVATGGQSRGYFVDLAWARGYAITITEPARHQWRVIVPESALVKKWRAGSRAGQPIRTWQRHPLTCQFMREKPAHTRLWFGFPGVITDPWLIAAVEADGEPAVEAAMAALHVLLHTTLPTNWS